jgi:hypothetical protein
VRVQSISDGQDKENSESGEWKIRHGIRIGSGSFHDRIGSESMPFVRAALDKGVCRDSEASTQRSQTMFLLSHPGLQACNCTQLNREYSMSHPNAGLVAATAQRDS